MIFRKFGIDRAIGYSSLAKIIQATGGVLTMFFIALSLSSTEQGYYYTFSSLLAVQIFFDLGVNFTISQYVAHEFAFLQEDIDGLLIGDKRYLSRLSSLLRLFSKWYLVASLLLLIILLITGYSFFEKNGVQTINWKLPWVLLIISTSLNLLISPYISFLEGLGKVKDIALMRLVAQIIQILVVWGVLLCDGKLFALGLSSLALFLVSLLFIWINSRNIFKQLTSVVINEKVAYKTEIFPFQWRIALSCISGYLIFQIFNPVLFAFSGPIVAGQMGMTLTVLNGILALTMSWTSTKAPFWSVYISRKEYDLLNISFHNTLNNSILVCSVCLILFSLFLSGLSFWDFSLSERFLPFNLILLLMITFLCNSIINVWATYLRCHKKEPFLLQAVIVGVLCCISTFLLGKYQGVDGIVIGYTVITLIISFPLSYMIFEKNKKMYQYE